MRAHRSIVASALLVCGAVIAAGIAPAQASVPTRKACAKGGACAIGSRGPGGGMVFITPKTKGNTTGRYFEAAPARWAGGALEPMVAWCDPASVAIGGAGARATAIGTGAANTTSLLGACASGAANTAHAYAGGGKTDWFLPSKDELNQMYKRIRNKGDFSVLGLAYWSSSEVADITAWGQYFIDGRQANVFKEGKLFVRPVRMF